MQAPRLRTHAETLVALGDAITNRDEIKRFEAIIELLDLMQGIHPLDMHISLQHFVSKAEAELSESAKEHLRMYSGWNFPEDL